MKRRRASFAAALAFCSALAGITVVSATPAAAEPGDTTMTCVREEDPPDGGGPIINCTISDPQGIKRVRYLDTVLNVDGTSRFGCDTRLGSVTVLEWSFRPPNKTKFWITDCQDPSSHATFIVLGDGTVRVIRNN